MRADVIKVWQLQKLKSLDTLTFKLLRKLISLEYSCISLWHFYFFNVNRWSNFHPLNCFIFKINQYYLKPIQLICRWPHVTIPLLIKNGETKTIGLHNKFLILFKYSLKGNSKPRITDVLSNICISAWLSNLVIQRLNTYGKLRSILYGPMFSTRL